MWRSCSTVTAAQVLALLALSQFQLSSINITKFLQISYRSIKRYSSGPSLSYASLRQRLDSLAI